MDIKSCRKVSSISIDFVKSQTNKVEKHFFNKTWDQFVYTICLIFLGFNYALISNLFAPALVDFKYIFHTTLNSVSFTNFYRSFGYCLGSLVGLLYYRINRQLVIAIMLFVLGTFSAAIPFCTDLWQVYLSSAISMFGAGALDCGGSVWLVEIWGQTSAALLQLSKATNGLAVILAPLIEEHFIVGELKVKNLTQFSHNSTAIDLANEELNYSVERRSKLKIPFLIAGAATLPITLILFVMFIAKRYHAPKAPGSSPETAGKKPELSAKVKYSLISLIALNLSTFNAMEMVHLNYSSVYYQDLPIHLSAQKAAEILSVVSATITLGKLFSAVASIKLKPEITIAYSYVFLAISMVLLYLGSNNQLVIWIGNGLIGFGFAAVWPAYFSVADNHFGLTNKISSIFVSVASICPMISPFICGPLIEQNPQIFLITELAFFILSIILYIIIIVILRRTSRSLKELDKYYVSYVMDCK